MTCTEGEWIDCPECDGRGKDDAEADGLCIYCHGKGQRLTFHLDDDDGSEAES
jgi:hypothetical protein